MRAVGENPAAAEGQGLNVNAVRTGAIVAGSSASARKGATQRVRSTPASMPLAMGAGIRLTQVPSGRTTAVSR